MKSYRNLSVPEDSCLSFSEALTSKWMKSPDLSAEDSSVIVPKTRESVFVATAEELIPKWLKPAAKEGKN